MCGNIIASFIVYKTFSSADSTSSATDEKYIGKFFGRFCGRLSAEALVTARLFYLSACLAL